ncbi:DUF6890 family protein [Escherichia coli]|uniref:DUF6890 family protein n=1 Tax=Escherichia coli TaxID=562 RepID=UPI003D7FEC8C
MEHNGLEQYLILRRHWLPGEGDNLDSIAAAIWLDNRHWENLRKATAGGIALALNGDK